MLCAARGGASRFATAAVAAHAIATYAIAKPSVGRADRNCAERQRGERQHEWQRNREVEVAECVAGDDRDCDRVDWRDPFDRAEFRNRRQVCARARRLQPDGSRGGASYGKRSRSDRYALLCASMAPCGQSRLEDYALTHVVSTTTEMCSGELLCHSRTGVSLTGATASSAGVAGDSSGSAS